jgi:hypothetical protein
VVITDTEPDRLAPLAIVFTAPEENVPLINKALEEGTAVPVNIPT